MLWHEGGDNFFRRYVIVPTPSASTCEATAQTLRAKWQAEVTHATITVECVPVVLLVKS